jgi:hypothetical protein
MAEFLGLGLSHYPGFVYPDERMSARIKQVLSSTEISAELRDVANWPLAMREEWSDDEDLGFAVMHRAAFVAGVRRLRSALNDFRPDAVVIFGDDQYENFREDVIPPFWRVHPRRVPDRPAPSPRVAFELGRRIVEALSDAPWRIALVGSASWSHAFLTKKHSYLYPDVDADRRRLAQMEAGDYDALRSATGPELEASGQHELLNRMALFGAMAQLGQRPLWSTLIETYAMNSSKAMALYAP